MQTIRLYEHDPRGPLIVEFDPVKHVYTVNGERWRNVSSAGKAVDLGKSDAFAWWAVNEMRDYQYANWPVDEKGNPKELDRSKMESLIEDGRKAHMNTKNKAAAIGRGVHDWLDAHLKARMSFGESPPLPANEQEKTACLAYLNYEEQHRIFYEVSEQMVASITHKYIGTLDNLNNIASIDGVRTIDDYKTSDDIRLTFRIQTALYAMAYNEEHPGNEVWRRVIHLLGKVTPTHLAYDCCYPDKTHKESTLIDFKAGLLAFGLMDWGDLATAALPEKKKKKSS